MTPELIKIIILLISFIVIGSMIYFFRYRNKEKPKVGIKRDDNLQYLKDYAELKLYWGSILLIILGVVVLIGIGVIELVFA